MTQLADPTEVQLEDAVAKIRPIIEQSREEAEQKRQLPDAVVTAMREAGLLRLWTPTEYGGSEVDLSVFMRTAESLARLDSPTGWVLATAGAGTLLTAFVARESASEIYASGPDVILPGASAPVGRGGAE